MTASNENTSGLDHFGWWVEHTVAEPMLIRPPAFCPASDNYTITPLVTAASAQARIAELEAERDAEKERADKLSAAISWLDYPFIDNRTAEPELRSRVGFMMKDAEPYRAALQQETQP